MAQLIDSNIFITIERRGGNLAGLAAFDRDEPVALASITASELLYGVYRAATPEQRTRREVFVEAILAAFPILPFDLLVARLWHHLAAMGQMIGDRDLVIAATAVTFGYDVLTDNVDEFSRIPGLTVKRPA